MVEHIEFVNNFDDLSTNQGFQFEFKCNRCESGYRTKFQPSITGKVAGALDTASSLFGGFLGRAANFTEQVRSAGWEKAHDEAFVEAVAGSKTIFYSVSTLQ